MLARRNAVVALDQPVLTVRNIAFDHVDTGHGFDRRYDRHNRHRVSYVVLRGGRSHPILSNGSGGVVDGNDAESAGLGRQRKL